MPNATSSERIIAFLLYQDCTPLDLIGPLQVLTSLPGPFHSVVVGDTLEPVATDTPIRLQATALLEDVPTPDILVIPGGVAGTHRVMHDERLLAYVRRASETAQTVMTVCTGSLILGAAGLLEGRDATTHWAAAPLLERYGARYQRHRWVESGKFLMTAGVSAGIDGALHLAARLTDEARALGIQAWIEYDPTPPFGPMDWTYADAQTLPDGWFEQRALAVQRARYARPEETQ